MGMFGSMWKEAEASAAKRVANRGAKRVASTTARSSGGRGFLARRSVPMGIGAGAIGGAYAMGRSSGARANSMVPPSTGIYGM